MTIVATLTAGQKADSACEVFSNIDGKPSKKASTIVLDSNKLARRSYGNRTNVSSKSKTTNI